MLSSGRPGRPHPAGPNSPPSSKRVKEAKENVRERRILGCRPRILLRRGSREHTETGEKRGPGRRFRDEHMRRSATVIRGLVIDNLISSCYVVRHAATFLITREAMNTGPAALPNHESLNHKSRNGSGKLPLRLKNPRQPGHKGKKCGKLGQCGPTPEIGKRFRTVWHEDGVHGWRPGFQGTLRSSFA